MRRLIRGGIRGQTTDLMGEVRRDPWSVLYSSSIPPLFLGAHYSEIRGQSKDSVAWMTSGGRIGTFQEEQADHVREDVWHDGTVHARWA